MTREELIKIYIMPACKNTWNEKICKQIEELFDKEPCEDAISRDHFDTRVRLALTMTWGELTDDFIDGICSVLELLKTEPSVNPQPNTEVLDKIRAEIENHCRLIKEHHCSDCIYCNSVMGVDEILEIIDKYKAESEDRANGKVL